MNKLHYFLIFRDFFLKKTLLHNFFFSTMNSDRKKLNTKQQRNISICLNAFVLIIRCVDRLKITACFKKRII